MEKIPISQGLFQALSLGAKNKVDDYQSDVQFGEWLRKQREQKGLTLERASKEAMIETSRLKALEVGYADRGITRSEAVRLCAVYKIAVGEFLTQANS